MFLCGFSGSPRGDEKTQSIRCEKIFKTTNRISILKKLNNFHSCYLQVKIIYSLNQFS